jgi:hypothetical protein
MTGLPYGASMGRFSSFFNDFALNPVPNSFGKRANPANPSRRAIKPERPFYLKKINSTRVADPPYLSMAKKAGIFES